MSNLLKKLLFLSTFSLLAVGCANQTNAESSGDTSSDAGSIVRLSPSLSFTQENVSVVLHETFDLSTLLDYENIVEDISFTFRNETDIASLNSSVLIANKVGTVEVVASYENVSDTINVIVVSDKPNIQYQVTNYEFDIRNDAFDLANEGITCTPHTSSLELVSDRNDYTFADGKITLNSTGDYAFSLVASYNDEKSDAYNFVIYAYDTIRVAGRGTITNPYHIKSAKDLKELSDAVLDYMDFEGKYFIQDDDIDISGYDNWEPIGTLGIPFEGTYNGNNKEVTGLSIDTQESWQGLFGFVTGTVKNVTVKGDINVTCHDEFVYSHSYAGGIAGGINNAAIIDSCVSYVNLHGNSYVGGIVGGIMYGDEMIVRREQSKIINCKNYGTITGDNSKAINEDAMYFGGICGESLGILTGNENYGSVEISKTMLPDEDSEDKTYKNIKYVGGVCGLDYTNYKYGMYDDEDLEIYASNDNKNYGDVTVNGEGCKYVGGVFGANVLPIHNCLNHGKVTASICVGGITGLNGTSSILSSGNSTALVDECVNYGEVVAKGRYAGGIASYSYFDITDSDNYGRIHGEGESTHHVAGITAYSEAGTTVSGCTNHATIDTTHRLGAGIVSVNNGDVENCVNEGSVTCDYRTGGIVSENLGHIIGCQNSGDIVGNIQYVGGIVAINGKSDEELDTVLYYCVNNGNVTCTNNGDDDEKNKNCVGGIAGWSSSNGTPSITYCQNTGTITGFSALGGIVGCYDTGGSPTINNLYNSGNITGTPVSGQEQLCGHIGGIIGMLGSNIDISHVYNTGNVSGYGGQISKKWRGVGGIVGTQYQANIDYAFNFGDVTANMMSGGITGYGDGSGSGTGRNKTINHSLTGGIITGVLENNSGGLAGRINKASVTNSVSYASVTPTPPDEPHKHIIYGKKDSTSTFTYNTSYTDTNVVNDLLKYIYSLNVNTVADPQASLAYIEGLEAQLNADDNAVLDFEVATGKKLAHVVSDTKASLAERIAA